MTRLIFLLVTIMLAACQAEESIDSTKNISAIDNISSIEGTDVLNLGSTVDMSLYTPLNTLMSDPDTYLDKPVTIKGRIGTICKKKGCWADFVAENSKLRIKVIDDVIVIPLHTLGKEAYATGQLKKKAFSLEETIVYLEHMASDAGEDFDATSVSEPMDFYQLQADAIQVAVPMN